MGQKGRREPRFTILPVYEHYDNGTSQLMQPCDRSEGSTSKTQTKEESRQEKYRKQVAEAKATELSTKREVGKMRLYIQCYGCHRKTSDRYGSSDELNWFRVINCTGGYCRRCSKAEVENGPIVYVLKSSCLCQSPYNPSRKLFFCSEDRCYGNQSSN
jgi:hypothetical protein